MSFVPPAGPPVTPSATPGPPAAAAPAAASTAVAVHAASPASAALVLADLEGFEQLVQQQLLGVGLPAGSVFVDISERHAMLSNIGPILQPLDADVRARSHYVSKMIAAAAVGLFDAALNYLWDELVNELRGRVSGFDLSYFYDIAAGNSDLRRHLKTEDDLAKVDDANLLRAAREIGLLTDVGFTRLDHIRYMRNYASAAHPNNVTISGLDLANWLQICIREVITTAPNLVTATTGKLLANIKADFLDNQAVNEAGAFFDRLPQDRADTLANGLWGLYTGPGRTAIIADNVRTLWPKLWPFVSEDTRSSYGIRHARASASADVGIATAARELLDLVGGTAYLSPEVRAVELTEALQALRTVHNSLNNFYNEGPPARRVAQVVGANGSVPAAVQTDYVRTIVEVFLGNGYGVCWAAEPTYRELIRSFDPGAASIALRLFVDPVFSSLLFSSAGAKQWTELLALLEPKLTGRTDRNLLDAIRAFSGRPDQMAVDSNLQRLATT